MWVRAGSLEKLQSELAKRLVGYAAEDVVSVSHSAEPISSKQSGGVWGGGHTTYKLGYSAVVLLRTE